MKLVSQFLLFLFKTRLHRLEKFKKYPLETQADNFFYLIKRGNKTAFGKYYDFDKILGKNNFLEAYEEFQNQVPIFSYDDLKPWIIRARQGEKSVIWPGKIKMFSKSAGTTSDKSKFIPVTHNSLQRCHYAAGRDAFSAYFKNYPDSKIFYGKILSLGGSRRQDDLNSENICGDVSAIIMSKLPAWVQIMMRVPSVKTAVMQEWEAKLGKIVSETKDENVVALAGVPAWVLVLLRKIEESTGRKITDLWPNLELFMYGGVAIGPYLEQFKEICGPKMNYFEIYSSAEGFFGIGDEKDKSDMLLLLDYEIFYEFIPLEDLSKPNPKAYSIGQVELDKNYAMIISTSGGLWRYLIGDTVKFTSLKPYRIVISGRIKSFINVFGEELMVDNANKALAAACFKTGSSIQDYSVAPIFAAENIKGRHEWLIEFIKEPENLESFAQILDEELQKVNSDYEAKRYKDMTLGRLKLVKARLNLFRDWLESKNKLGGQNKVLRLMNDRDLFEEMLSLNK